MSFLLAGLIIAGTSGAVAVGRWLSRRQEGASEPKRVAGEGDGAGDGEGTAPASSNDEAKKAAKRGPKRKVEGPSAHLEGFPCQLGDVIMRITGEEAWLAGGVVLSEEAPIAALFVAPDAGQDCAIYVRPHPRESVFWMAPLDPGAVLVGGEPPTRWSTRASVSIACGACRFARSASAWAPRT